MKKPWWHERRTSREIAAVCTLAFAAACTGTLGDSTDGDETPSTGSDGPSTGSAPPPFQPAAGMLRRLTRTQFRNAVRDVFDVEVDVNKLDSDSWNGNFAVIGAATVVTSERGVEQYHTAIEDAVNTVFADSARRDQFIGCAPSGAQDDACVRGFIETLGLRAWRRPLEATEVDRLAGVAATAATELGSAIEGARWATVALFTSPNFLYRPELGAPSASGSLRLTGYEMASRLAFLVWNSLPDKELLDQAKSGVLETVEGVREAATRLLDTPAGREAVGAFAEEYMRLERIGTQAKDTGLFPEYGPALQEAMVRDMRGTWEVLAFDDQASALDLFSTTKVVVNTELAELYGLDTTGLTSNSFEVRSLPADGPRLGILGKAGFLSQFANQKEGSPTLRGRFMSEALLCKTIPLPPGDVDIVLDEPTADMPLTKRQRLERHRTDPTCAGCHAYMDPLALPLENFDAIGRYRTTDHGLPIDPSGSFDKQPVADARELGEAIGSNEKVAQCLVRKYYSYAAGHEERDVDGSVVNELSASFEASGFQLRELVLDIVTSKAFSSVAPQR
ncbi:hypothetical protein BE04_38255 [Sorangium cellulosum]|uniref:Uncharacterized protein n=1 Tax=Sorangium cellulosum TaxID=56 RepID=A0A150P5W9_SORCE|nr:hypothetical protein BE04_38255 [Sorangium cellulosum]